MPDRDAETVQRQYQNAYQAAGRRRTNPAAQHVAGLRELREEATRGQVIAAYDAAKTAAEGTENPHLTALLAVANGTLPPPPIVGQRAARSLRANDRIQFRGKPRIVKRVYSDGKRLIVSFAGNDTDYTGFATRAEAKISLLG